MKASASKSWLLALASIFFLQSAVAQSSGRVVINEYMPWTVNGCGTTSEFVELMNFGPGPVNIGCYVLTTGRYSITIPPNTILQPGEFYVIAGQSFIPADCANIDSIATGVYADLNWNTCNCTSGPIPTTGDGLLTDGGAGNTPLVLFDPSRKVVDAVVRSLPAESSTSLTSSNTGGCPPIGFNMDTMSIRYEQLGMSAGRGNSFARTTDGDCSWVKDPQQSASASNNRGGELSDIRYNFSMINPSACNNQGGRVSVYVEHSNYAAIFPMNYTLAVDINENGVFDQADLYTTHIDSTAPSIDVNDLPAGRYRLTISSANDCYLRTFEFTILTCYPVLPVQIEFVKYGGKKAEKHLLQWKLTGEENLALITVQKAKQNEAFLDEKNVLPQSGASYYSAEVEGSEYQLFRLRILTKNGSAFYSPVVSASHVSAIQKSWPNPVINVMNIQLLSAVSKKATYAIFHSSGKNVAEGQLQVPKGQSVHQIDLPHLSSGLYQIQVTGLSASGQPISFRFVKH